MDAQLQAQAHVLLMDDDPDVCAHVSQYLSENDLRVSMASSGSEILDLIGGRSVDLLLLETRLRREDGLRLTRKIREVSGLPIVILSGVLDEADRVMGLELGADDYVTKPFSPRELLARIRAVLRRSAPLARPTPVADVRAYRFAGWELNVPLRRLRAPDGSNVRISRGEFSLLRAFLGAPNAVMTRDELLERSRLHSCEVYDRAVDMQIWRLRQKMERDPSQPRFIRTERGSGYSFEARVQAVR